MTLRTRLTVMVAGAVAVAVLGGAYAALESTRRELRGEVDAFLLTRLTGFSREMRPLARGQQDPRRAFERFRLGDPADGAPGGLIDFDVVAQVLDPRGQVLAALPGQPALPVTESELALTAGGRSLRDVRVGEVEYRMLTAALPGGRRVQIARSLTETNQVLGGLRARLGFIALVGTALAGLGAWLLARRVTQPVEALTAACERVAATQDLATPVPSPAKGELGRLAASFNTMLGALASSRHQQRRLVADAGHELRTPLTAIRTNVDFLQRASTLPDTDRHQVLAETRLELDEITNLVDELVQLATDAPRDQPMEAVGLAALTEEVVGRFRRRTGRTITLDLGRAGEVDGHRALLDRAVSNLVDNALKFSPAESVVEVSVVGGRVEVCDRGPGVAAQDQHRVFDRFYRSAEARTLPGSGLGLAIVAQVVEHHRGTVALANRPGGGLSATIDLPVR